MSNKYILNQVKTENRSTYTTKKFPMNSQGNNSHFAYSSQSPSSYYSKTQYEKEDQPNNSNLSRYSKIQQNKKIERNIPKISPRNNYNLIKYKGFSEKRENQRRPSLERSFHGHENSNHSLYISSFTKKNSPEEAKNIINKSTTFITSRNFNSNNQANSTNLNNNKNRYANLNNNNFNFKERKITTHVSNLRYEREKKNEVEPISKRIYTNKSYQGNKYPLKYYKNNPLVNSNNDYNIPRYGKNQIKLIAQKICNIYIRRTPKINKGKNKKKNNNDLDGSNKMIEYEEENQNLDINNYNYRQDYMKSESDNFEINHNLPGNKFKISKKNKKNNTNFQIKKGQGVVMEMQKAQSFEQPRDVNYISPYQNTNPNLNQKNTNKKKKYEITQLKNCDMELTLLNDNKNTNLNNDNSKVRTTQYQIKESNTEMISKPKIELNDSNNKSKNINNDDKIRKIEITKINQNKKITQPISVVMNKRSNSNMRLDINVPKIEEAPNKTTFISHRNYKSISSSNSNINTNRNEKEKEKEKKQEVANQTKANIMSIPNSFKKQADRINPIQNKTEYNNTKTCICKNRA